MVFWSRFTVLISKAKELSFCRWVSEWASLALLGVLVVWFAGFCYLIENLPSGGKIIPLRGKKKSKRKQSKPQQVETWKLENCCFLHMVFQGSVRELQKRLLLTLIFHYKLQQWFPYVLAPEYDLFSSFHMPYNILHFKIRINLFLAHPPWTIIPLVLKALEYNNHCDAVVTLNPLQCGLSTT